MKLFIRDIFIAYIEFIFDTEYDSKMTPDSRHPLITSNLYVCLPIKIDLALIQKNFNDKTSKIYNK